MIVYQREFDEITLYYISIEIFYRYIGQQINNKYKNKSPKPAVLDFYNMQKCV